MPPVQTQVQYPGYHPHQVNQVHYHQAQFNNFAGSAVNAFNAYNGQHPVPVQQHYLAGQPYRTQYPAVPNFAQPSVYAPQVQRPMLYAHQGFYGQFPGQQAQFLQPVGNASNGIQDNFVAPVTLSQQLVQPQQRVSGTTDVIDLTKDESQVPVAPECSPPAPVKEKTPEPSQPKSPSAVAERIRYLKANIKDCDYPKEIRLLRTMINLSANQKRHYCKLFWPSNEAALEDLHEAAKLSPDFSKVYYFRIAWHADLAGGASAEKIAAIEKMQAELKENCKWDLAEMKKNETLAQTRAMIGQVRGHKGIAARKVQWDQYDQLKIDLDDNLKWRRNAPQRAEATEEEKKAVLETKKVQRKRKRDEKKAALELERAAKTQKRDEVQQEHTPPNAPEEFDHLFEAMIQDFVRTEHLETGSAAASFSTPQGVCHHPTPASTPYLDLPLAHSSQGESAETTSGLAPEQDECAIVSDASADTADVPAVLTCPLLEAFFVNEDTGPVDVQPTSMEELDECMADGETPHEQEYGYWVVRM